jgi:transposase
MNAVAVKLVGVSPTSKWGSPELPELRHRIRLIVRHWIAGRIMTKQTTPKRDFLQLEQRRLMAAQYFSQGFSKADVSRQLEVSFASVRRWHQAWLRNGDAGLAKAGRAGRKPKIVQKDMERIREAIRLSPVAHGFTATRWTVKRVQALILQITGTAFNSEHLRRILKKAAIDWKTTPPTVPFSFLPARNLSPAAATNGHDPRDAGDIVLFTQPSGSSFRRELNDRSGTIQPPILALMPAGNGSDRGRGGL